MAVRRATFQAIGTRWDIQVYDSVTGEDWARLMERIYVRIEAFDKAYSRFRSDSWVARIAKRAGQYELPSDGYRLLKLYAELYEFTAGRVTPLIGRTMEEAGYDAAYSLQSSKLQQPPRWEEVLSFTEHSLTVRQPVLLDFGAAGKGLLVDLVAQLIEEQGVESYMINAGGDIRHRSAANEPVEVGLENPLDVSEAIGIVTLANQSLCASSGSKRKWEGFTHIIDPSSLTSPDQVLATWVIADDTMTADGLATALFFQEASVLQKQFSFSYVLMDKDNSLHYTKNFPVTLFEAENA